MTNIIQTESIYGWMDIIVTVEQNSEVSPVDNQPCVLFVSLHPYWCKYI